MASEREKVLKAFLKSSLIIQCEGLSIKILSNVFAITSVPFGLEIPSWKGLRARLILCLNLLTAREHMSLRIKRPFAMGL